MRPAAMIRNALALLQKRRRKGWFLAAIGTIVTIAVSTDRFWDVLQHIRREMSGPDVIVTVIPFAKSQTYGKPHLLYEFRFDDASRATGVDKEEDLKILFTSRSILLNKFSCDREAGASPFPTDFHELNIGIQNRGWQTAKDYTITITFSGEISPDPGVRIAWGEAYPLVRVAPVGSERIRIDPDSAQVGGSCGKNRKETEMGSTSRDRMAC